MNIICLDAEFTETEELLELSMFNICGEEIYHSFYRPEHVRTWRTDIHHITPEMVRGERLFTECIGEVRQLLDNAFAITGFAVDNDLRILEHYGVEGIDRINVLDVKDMFWYMRGRDSDMSPFAVPSLLVCANSLGLDFVESEAHCASTDTEYTLKCFKLLLDEFRQLEQIEEEQALLTLKERIEEAKSRFMEEFASGFVRLFSSGELYKLKFGRLPESDSRHLVMEIPVADRYKAEYELRKRLKKKEVPDKLSVYKLNRTLLEEIRNYRNEYDAEESAWCKKVVRNLSRLSL